MQSNFRDNLAACIGAAFFIIYTLWLTVLFPSGGHWDFTVFYDAANSFRLGYDVYDKTALMADGLAKGGMSYTYPPHVVLLFLPFSFLPLSVAASLWFFLKLGMLGHMAIICRRFFATSFDLNSWGLVIAFFAFNSTILWDLMAGNTSIPQQWLLWWGLSFFVRHELIETEARDRNIYLGILLISLAASIKLMPLFFLGALVLLKKPKPLYFVAALGFPILLALGNYIAAPEYSQHFIREALSRVSAERGIIASSLQGLWADFFVLINTMSSIGIKLAPESSKYAYYLSALGIFSFSLWHAIKNRSEYFGKGIIQGIFFLSVTYVLVIPRVKSYALVVAIPALFYVLKQIPERFRLALILLVCFPHVSGQAPIGRDLNSSALLGPMKKMLLLGYEYLPLVGVAALWLCFIVFLSKESAAKK